MATKKLINTREVVRDLVPRFATGIALDIGGGQSKYRELITPHVKEYLVSDLYPSPGVDFIEDARKLDQKSDTYDTILCFQVLEHIDDTRAVVGEIRRVLKKGGRAIITAPFIAAEHGYPSDYHRFTVEGMKWYFEKEGFKILESGKQGSTFTVLSELMRFLYRYTYKNKGRIRRFVVNKTINLFTWLDRKSFMQSSNFYTNVYLVAEK